MMSKCLAPSAKPSAKSLRPSRAAAIAVYAVARPTVSKRSELKRSQAALLSATGAILLQVGPALAADGEAASKAVASSAGDVDVDSAVGTVIDVIKSAGQFIKGSITTVQSGVQVLKEGYDVAAPVLKQGYDVVSPVVSEAYNNVSTAAAPLVQQAAPVLSDALGSGANTVRQTLQSSGVDIASVKNTAGAALSTALEATNAATPFAFKVVQFLVTTNPATLGQYALGAAGVWFFAPPLLKLVFGSSSTGSLSATATLNAVVQDNDVVLIDVRGEREKDASGVPDVPSAAAARVVEVELATVADKKLRGLLRDPTAIEAQTTALQIASLKRINKGTKIIIMDKNGPSAQAVAKELAKKGYSKVYSVDGGFDGSRGWIQSKLQIKPYTSSSTFAAPLLARIGTRSTKQLAAPRS